jgi:hypothetical protein
MKNNKPLTIPLTALAFLLLSAGITYAASEDGFRQRADLTEESGIGMKQGHDQMRGDRKGQMNGKMRGPREEVREAIENNDYEAFLNLTEDSPIQVEINEDEFEKLVEAHSLMTDGKFEEAREIMDELGMRGPRHNRI